nr:hypothetical protein GCM10020093_100580 [Planobispora longispora]
MIRVLLADDEAMIRAGVRAILAADPEIEVVAEAGDGREAIDLTLSHRPDVVLLDIRMPRLDGLAAVAELRRTAPETGVLMLTTFGEDEYIARALGRARAGSCSRRATRVSCWPGSTPSPRAPPTCRRRSPTGSSPS